MKLEADREATEAPAWMQSEERGSFFWLSVMTRLSLQLGRQCSRLVLYGIAFYFVIFARKARQASRVYLSRCLGRSVGWRDCYRHVLAFSTTIHDRVFLLNDQFDRFNIEHVGTEQLHAEYEQGSGVLLLGAHLGSFEVLRALVRNNPRLNMSMAMYPENARRINRALAAINPRAMQDIISLGTLDAMLAVNSKLDEGAFVGILADRASGPNQYQSLQFLGAPAQFPIGPFRLAVMLKRPVYFMAGIYRGGNRYMAHFERLDDFSSNRIENREAAVTALMQKYVATLEQHCRHNPYNWFNFYDFWKQD
jgi:predicted LPLAT superfamily acyltransferase